MLLIAAAHATTVRWFAPADGGCTWNEAPLPYATPKVLVSWPTPCSGEPIVAVHDGRVLVRTDSAVSELVESRGVVTALVLGQPPVGEVGIVGYDARGTPWALTVSSPEPVEGALVFEGKRWSTAEISDGLPALAHAFRWTRGEWKRTETTLTTTGWDYAQEASALKVFSRLVPYVGGAFRTFLYADWVGAGREMDITTELPWLDAHFPHVADTGEWRIRDLGATRVAWWAEAAEFLTPSLPVLVDRGEGWTTLLRPEADARGIAWARHMSDGAWLLTRVDFEPARVFALDGSTDHVLPAGSLAPMLWPVPTEGSR